jgi:hypothetical protein
MMVRTTGGLALALAVIALFPTAIMAQAREPTGGELGYSPNNYWGLTIYLHPPFGAPKVWVEVTGPFGHQEGQSFNNTIPDNVLGVPYASLTLTKWGFPSGYHYEIGIGAPDLTSSNYTPFLRFNACLGLTNTTPTSTTTAMYLWFLLCH